MNTILSHFCPRSLNQALGRCAAVALVLVAVPAVAGPADSKTAEAAQGARSPSASAPEPTTPGSLRGSVVLDPLGFLLFGPTLALELGAGQFSGVVYGRWLNPGLVAKNLFEKNTYSFALSGGGGARGRYYLKPGLSGLFGGVGLELLTTHMESEQLKLATRTLLVVPHLELGYHHRVGPLLVGSTVIGGYAVKASSSVENLPGGTLAGFFEVEDPSNIYGGLSLDVGVTF